MDNFSKRIEDYDRAVNEYTHAVNELVDPPTYMAMENLVKMEIKIIKYESVFDSPSVKSNLPLPEKQKVDSISIKGKKSREDFHKIEDRENAKAEYIFYRNMSFPGILAFNGMRRLPDDMKKHASNELYNGLLNIMKDALAFMQKSAKITLNNRLYANFLSIRYAQNEIFYEYFKDFKDEGVPEHHKKEADKFIRIAEKLKRIRDTETELEFLANHNIE